MRSNIGGSTGVDDPVGLVGRMSLDVGLEVVEFGGLQRISGVGKLLESRGLIGRWNWSWWPIVSREVAWLRGHGRIVTMQLIVVGLSQLLLSRALARCIRHEELTLLTGVREGVAAGRNAFGSISRTLLAELFAVVDQVAGFLAVSATSNWLGICLCIGVELVQVE